MTIAKITLLNEIRKIDEKTPLLLGQNFDDLVYKINEIVTVVNSITTSADSTDEYEANAITEGPEEPS